MILKKRKDAVEKILMKKRNDILMEAKEEIKGHFNGDKRGLVETAIDDGDWSFAGLAEDVDMTILEKHKDTLYKIDETLRKLYDGTYGICEDCGQEISEKRLVALPFVIYCIECQKKKEERR